MCSNRTHVHAYASILTPLLSKTAAQPRPFLSYYHINICDLWCLFHCGQGKERSSSSSTGWHFEDDACVHSGRISLPFIISYPSSVDGELLQLLDHDAE